MLMAAIIGAATALLGCSLAAVPPGPAPVRVHSRPVRFPDHAVAARKSRGEGQSRWPSAARPTRPASSGKVAESGARATAPVVPGLPGQGVRRLAGNSSRNAPGPEEGLR
ncbi:hypothetical protein LK10_01625 [Sinomonas humi]|uniref:Lipoprotein n=2 Tax=Sinomonas humi TaxID=1338436 RepID=A0A0B2ANM5_9MICC|nr:hypothetical protein LK10_01625 [Sinomonas humi]